MRIETNDGRIYQGTPLDIVGQMKSRAFGGDTETVLEYAKRTATTLLGSPIDGDDESAACESLVRGMLAAGIVHEVEASEPAEHEPGDDVEDEDEVSNA